MSTHIELFDQLDNGCDLELVESLARDLIDKHKRLTVQRDELAGVLLAVLAVLATAKKHRWHVNSDETDVLALGWKVLKEVDAA